jgi:rod shape-determining protein MreD
MRQLLIYTLRFLLLILFQVLILNNIALQWWAQPIGFPIFTPYIYPLFVLLLPFQTPQWLVLCVGFVLGISIDFFMNTPGMHAAALILMSQFRMGMLKAFLPNKLKEYENMAPSVKSMGWTVFIAFSILQILIHHSALFILEIWSIQNFGYLLLKILASTITSILLIIVYQLLFPASKYE